MNIISTFYDIFPQIKCLNPQDKHRGDHPYGPTPQPKSLPRLSPTLGYPDYDYVGEYHPTPTPYPSYQPHPVTAAGFAVFPSVGPDLVPVVDEGAVHVPVDQVKEIMNICVGKRGNKLRDNNCKKTGKKNYRRYWEVTTKY